MRDPIEGKVIRVFDSRNLAINRGASHGVEIGMRFVVRSADLIPLLDPDTGKEIDAVPLDKTEVKVVEVRESTSTARTFRTIPGRPGLAVFGPTPSREETISTDELTLAAEHHDEISNVRSGDPVREMTT